MQQRKEICAGPELDYLPSFYSLSYLWDFPHNFIVGETEVKNLYLSDMAVLWLVVMEPSPDPLLSLSLFLSLGELKFLEIFRKLTPMDPSVFLSWESSPLHDSFSQLSHQLEFTNVKSLFFISREPFENYTGQFFSVSFLNCDLTALFIDHPYALPSVFSFRVHVHNLDLYIRKKECSWRAGK